jgi:manganese-dependent ADP-ribose/CDP-alcohol diphosphatase
MTSQRGGTPLFEFGVVADPQYVDIEDGTNYDKSLTRRYRQSFQTFCEASRSFKDVSTVCNMVLGDTLDGKAGNLLIHDKCLQEIIDESHNVDPGKWHFVVGNHDLYCFTRSELRELLYSHVVFGDKSGSDGLYYEFSPYHGSRFVVLDSFDICEMRATSEEKRETAVALLRAKNPNIANCSPGWLDGISEEDARYNPANGALSDQQLEWLRDVLQDALNKSEKCFIFSHVPTYRPSTQPSTLLWNCEEVLSVLQSYPNVVAYFAGHDHDGGYAVDEAGIHHVVAPAPLECDEGEVAYGRVAVYEDHMELKWTGKTPLHTTWPTVMPYRGSDNCPKAKE